MSKLKVKLNSSGVRELLKSAEIKSAVDECANNAVSRLGSGYEKQDRNYPERSGVVVKAVTHSAMKENAENNTILKAVGSSK